MIFVTLDRPHAFLHTDRMRAASIIPVVVSLWALCGCSVLSGSGSDAALEGGENPPAQPIAAQTLPPVYTETPTPTSTATLAPTPTPFTVILEEELTPSATASISVPTPGFTFTGWELFEARPYNFSIEIPNTMRATNLGQNIIIASPSNAEVPLPLRVELRIDSRNSFRLPDGVNPADPRSVLDGVLSEIEAAHTSLTMIRAVTDIQINSKPAAEAAAKTTQGEGDLAEETVWYLAVVLHDEVVVRVYASSPAETGGAYLAIAERITDSLSTLTEP